MTAAILAQFRKVVSSPDWSLWRGSALVSAGLILARLVGFCVSIIQARLFTPAEFGEIQYAITIAGVFAIFTQPFGQHVIARFISHYKNDELDLRRKLSSAWGLLLIILFAGLSFGFILVKLSERIHPGVLLIFLGLTFFYAYWGLARGYQAAGRLAIVDLANNLTQIFLIVMLIQIVGMHSTLTAIAIQGLACFLPLILLQISVPLPIHFNLSGMHIRETKEILKFSLPVWFSHACFILYNTSPIIFLEYFWNKETVGVFNLALTISLVFTFVPTGIATLLMPRIAASRQAKSRKLLFYSVGISSLINCVLYLLYLISGNWIIARFFGIDYLPPQIVQALLGIMMILVGMHSIITAAFLGWGRPEVETASRLFCVITTISGCWFLIPAYGALGAASALLAGIIVGLIVYGFVFIQNAKKPKYPVRRVSE